LQARALIILKLEVPTSGALLPGGKGADAVNNNCLSCYSADHLLNQQDDPFMGNVPNTARSG
jgi:hypothetical protein